MDQSAGSVDKIADELDTGLVLQNQRDATRSLTFEQLLRFARTGSPFRVVATTDTAKYWAQQHANPASETWRAAYTALLRRISPDNRLYRAEHLWLTPADQYWLAAADSADTYTRTANGQLRLVQPYWCGPRLVVEVRGPQDITLHLPRQHGVALTHSWGFEWLRVSVVGHDVGVLFSGAALATAEPAHDIDQRTIGEHDLRIVLNGSGAGASVLSVWCGHATNRALTVARTSDEWPAVAGVSVYLTGVYTSCAAAATPEEAARSVYVAAADALQFNQRLVIQPRLLPHHYMYGTATFVTLRIQFVEANGQYQIAPLDDGPWQPYQTQALGPAPFVLSVDDTRATASWQTLLFNDGSTSRHNRLRWPTEHDGALPDHVDALVRYQMNYHTTDIDQLDDAELQAALAIEYTCAEDNPAMAVPQSYVHHGIPDRASSARINANYPNKLYYATELRMVPPWLSLRISTLHPSWRRLRAECQMSLHGDDPFNVLSNDGALGDLYVCLLPELRLANPARDTLRLPHTTVRLALHPGDGASVHGAVCANLASPMAIVAPE